MKKTCKHLLGQYYLYDESMEVYLNDSILECDFNDVVWYGFCSTCGVKIRKRHKDTVRRETPKQIEEGRVDNVLSSSLDGMRDRLLDEWLSANPFNLIKKVG